MKTTSWRRDLGAAALIFGATLIVYFPALRGGFVWDDDVHITKPALRSLHGLWLIWFHLGETPQYYPLLHSAFWLEHRLWGDQVLWYHLLNVLLHATSACLFLVILRRLMVGRVVPNPPIGLGGRTSVLGTTRSTFFSAPVLAAFLFALHPVCVESVALISEQKNTLSTVFYLLAALAYLNFDKTRPIHLATESTKSAEKTNTSSSLRSLCSLWPKVWGWYFIASALFILALLSKSVTATLPAALLVVFWWQRGRLSWKRDVVPLFPWLAIGIVSGLFTAWVERTSIHATGPEFDLTAMQRCLVAGRVIWFYLGKLVWPADLILIYPRWVIDASAWWQYLFPLAFVALAAALALVCRRARGPLAGLLLFAGSLLPALGFFNVYPFKYSFVADHFQYLATLGIMAAAAAAIFRISKFEIRNFVALAIICTLGTLTFRQCHMYRDAETLYRTTIERNPGCWIAYNNLGGLMLDRGRKAEAISYYQKTLQLKSDDAIPHNNLGLALAGVGSLPEAIAQYQEALRLMPDYPEAHANLGIALLRSGRIPESTAEGEEAVRLAPDYAAARADLARALAAEGRLPEAIAQYEAALRLKPDYAEVCNNLGVALAEENRLPEALDRLEEAVRLAPDYADAHENFGLVLHAVGRDREAEAQAAEAARIRASDRTFKP